MQPAPISERRLAANRANALKSTGPRTPEGKRRVSQNACRHRLYARVHTLLPRYEAFLCDRAHRHTAGIQDPVLRALRYEFFMASGYEEILWANQDSLFNHWLAECDGDNWEANANYFTDETNLEALHRFHAHHARRMDAVLKALIRYSRFAAKRQGLPCENPQTLAEALIQAALRRIPQPSLDPAQPAICATEQQQTQAHSAGSRTETQSNPTPSAATPVTISVRPPARSTPTPIRLKARNQTRTNPPPTVRPRHNNVICITRGQLHHPRRASPALPLAA